MMVGEEAQIAMLNPFSASLLPGTVRDTANGICRGGTWPIRVLYSAQSSIGGLKAVSGPFITIAERRASKTDIGMSLAVGTRQKGPCAPRQAWVSLQQPRLPEAAP